MKVLITGNLGYVGPVVVRYLRRTHPNARLIGFDSAFFALSTTAATVLPERFLDEQHFGDVREIPESLLEGLDAVIHLAAVSNDPIGNKFERVTEEVNYRASVELGRKARKAAFPILFSHRAAAYTVSLQAPRGRSRTRSIRRPPMLAPR